MNLSFIKKHFKLLSNTILLLTTFTILLFIHYNGDEYISSLIDENTSNIIAYNIKNPFQEDSQDTTTTQLTSSKEKSSIADLSNWQWPTTNNYTITTYYSTSHKAIDIYSYDGYNSDIYAANNGTVIEINNGCTIGDLSCNGKAGNYIVIKHNNQNYYTVYMHLNKIYVSVGDVVTQKDVIASMGNTGNVSPVPTTTTPYNGTHLHFCLYVGRPFHGGYAINPLNLYN